MLFTLLLACTAGEEDPLLTDPGSTDACALFIPESVLDFGSVEVTAVPGERLLRFRNDGEADCIISETQVLGATEEFTVSPVDTQALGPRETRDLLLRYDPLQDGGDQAELHFLSNDPLVPRQVVQLQGTGRAPRLEASIQEQAEPTLVGCTEEFVLLLSNTGSRTLEVSELSLAVGSDLLWRDSLGSEFSDAPFSLGAGQTQAYTLLFTPQSADGAQEDTIQIRSDDPEEPLAALPFKAAVDADAYAQHIEVPLRGKSDVLFVLDWTSAELAPFVAAFDTFRSQLTALDLDYQVSAVVSSDGCHFGGAGPITSDMSAEAQDARFGEQACESVEQCSALTGSDSERAFMLIEKATSATNTSSGGCNEGLFREDAELHVISVSDEAEQSFEEMKVHLARLQDLKDDPDNVVLHGMGGPAPKGCEYAEFYDRYYQATLATGGIFRNLCEPDMDAHMTAFAQAVVPILDPIALEAYPLLGSIEVSEDGVALSSGWSVDQDALTLRFDDDAQPAPGSEVVISYVSPPKECRAP